MLFNTIRDFFVEHIFGGATYDGRVFNPHIGQNQTNHNVIGLNGIAVTNPSVVMADSQTLRMSVADWLSTTATIVSMIVILILICLFIRWIFKVVSGAIILR